MTIDIDPDGVLAKIGAAQDNLLRKTNFSEVHRKLAAVVPSQGAAGPRSPAEPGKEPDADQTPAEPAATHAPAADSPAADLLGAHLADERLEALPPDAELASDMGEQPPSATAPLKPIGHEASKRAAPPTSPAVKPAPTERKRARGGTPPALIAPPAPASGFGKIGRVRLALILENVELMPGESADDYADFAQAIDSELDPQGPIDLIFVADYRYVRWELRRVRLWKNELQRGTATAAFVAQMEAHLPNLDEAARAKRWHDGRPKRKTREAMQEAGVTKMGVLANGVAEHLALFQALEALDARLDARSRDLLREYDRQREARERRQNNRPMIEGMFRPADNENEENGDDSATGG